MFGSYAVIKEIFMKHVTGDSETYVAFAYTDVCKLSIVPEVKIQGASKNIDTCMGLLKLSDFNFKMWQSCCVFRIYNKGM
jgi:hypothetical protein